MTVKMKLFALAVLVVVFMAGAWGVLSGNPIIGILVGGMSFASFLVGSAATTRLLRG